MNFRQTLLIVFINLSLISLIFAATIASIAKSTTNSSNVGETKKVITTACDCVAFYLCDFDDVVTLPASSGESCAAENSNNVCCKTTVKPSAVVTESTTKPSNVGDAKKVISTACECVPFYLCNTDDVVTLPDFSGEACAAKNSNNVCCKVAVKSSGENK